MDDRNPSVVGTVEVLRRYPVKSMLGEAHETLAVSDRGVAGDRAWAILDEATGKVASAKRSKLWRDLLTCAARTLPNANGAAAVEIALPDGTRHRAGDPALDGLMSALTGRQVRLISVPPDDSEVDRAHPEAQLAEGPDADVASDILKLGAAAPPGTFSDYAPLHLLTTATLDGLAASDDAVEELRCRANVVIRSPSGTARFPENAWVDGTVRIGPSVALRIVLQTPRCAIPTLAHGALPPRPGALRSAVKRNRVEIPGFGNQPCAGVYAQVLQAGTIRQGDTVSFMPA